MENTYIVLHVWFKDYRVVKCIEVEYKTKCGLVMFVGDGIS